MLGAWGFQDKGRQGVFLPVFMAGKGSDRNLPLPRPLGGLFMVKITIKLRTKPRGPCYRCGGLQKWLYIFVLIAG